MSADLMGMKESFSLMVGKVQPWILSHFMIWLDLKVAEYKVHGHMILDQSGIPTLNWLSDNVFAQACKVPSTPFKANQQSLEFQVSDQSQLTSIVKQYPTQSQSYHEGSIPNDAENLPSTSSSVSVSRHDFTSSQVNQDLPNNGSSEEIVTKLMSMTSQEQRSRLVNEIDLQTHDLPTVASRSKYQTVDTILPTHQSISKNSIDLTDEPEIKLEPLSPDNMVILDNQPSMDSNESFIRANHDQNGGIAGISHSHFTEPQETIELPSGSITVHISNDHLNESNNIMGGSLQTSHTTTQSEQDIKNNVHISSISQPSLETLQEFEDRLIVQNVSTLKLPNTSRWKGGSSLTGGKKKMSGKVGSKLMCQICGTFFRCRSSLSRHKWLHFEKRHRCFLCEKAFHRKEHLIHHLERHAKCKMCHSKGNNVQAIEEHFKMCHPNAT